MKRIYLDWNATAPLLPDVRDAMIAALDTTWGNASSIHHDGQVARSVIERARRAVARAVNAPAQAVVLTSGATESNNQVLRHHCRKTENPVVVCTAVEHPSVLAVVDDLAREGVDTHIWPVDALGRLDVSWLDTIPTPTLVSVMAANNESGNIYPIRSIAERVHGLGAHLHVDATQALGRVPLDFDALDVDFMTLSFHKMGGPKGIGAIILREGLTIESILAGGHQERGRRPGTENVPAAAGLEAGMRVVVEQGAAWNERLLELEVFFREQLQRLPHRWERRGDPEAHLPNTFNVAFDGIDGEDLLLALDLSGLSVSSGSACTAGSLEPSHVVLAMGFDEASARKSIRVSFGPSTTEDELKLAAERIGAAVDRLASI